MRHQPGIKILFLGASPTNLSRIRVDDEVRRIKKRLEQSRMRDRFELIYETAVRARELSTYLLRHNPHIVHISGHGVRDIFLLKHRADVDPACVILNATVSEGVHPSTTSKQTEVIYTGSIHMKDSSKVQIGNRKGGFPNNRTKRNIVVDGEIKTGSNSPVVIGNDNYE
ncbi:MAG: hypothetical protein MJE77_39520 [Proteobacteria bacterium]|nr:hypothetical protein [Pseudomonadota bacterium]